MQNWPKFFTLYVGNLLEHYDMALYGFLSPLFATLFFSGEDYLSALMITYAIIPLSMVAKPLGSLFFGYLGDRYSRVYSLSLSLFGVAIATVFIGMLPSYQSAGAAAPILLLTARLVQSFFSSAETMGGGIYLLENLHTEKERDIASSFYSTSTIAGILIASSLISLFYLLGITEACWRTLYFFGAVTALMGAILRMQDVKVAPTSGKSFKQKPNFMAILKEQLNLFVILRREVVMIMVASGFSYACYSMAFVFMTGFAPLVTDVTKEQIALLNTCMLMVDFLALPLMGVVATCLSRTTLMSSAALVAFFAAMPLLILLESASFPLLIGVRIAFVLIGVCFSATLHSWAQSLIPYEHRYTAINFAYAIGSQLFGGTTALISLWLYRQSSVVAAASLYWLILAALAYGAICASRQQEQDSLFPNRAAGAPRT